MAIEIFKPQQVFLRLLVQERVIRWHLGAGGGILCSSLGDRVAEWLSVRVLEADSATYSCVTLAKLLSLLGNGYDHRCAQKIGCMCFSALPTPQRLPFTIPELVHASPCRSSDGVFYTGKHPSSPVGPAGHSADRLHALSGSPRERAPFPPPQAGSRMPGLWWTLSQGRRR